MNRQQPDPAAGAEEQGYYQQIFEASSDGLVINDLATELVVEANPAFCRMHGYTHDEIVGLHPTVIIHPDDHEVLANYLVAIAEGRDFLTRARDVRKDGSVFEVEVHGIAFRFRGADCVLGSVRDITLEVQAKAAAQEERQRIARDLHDSVSQSLFSLGLHARRTELALRAARLPADSEAATAAARVTELAHGTLAEMRALIFELRPAALSEEGVGEAITKHTAAVSAREHLPIDVTVPAERLPLGPEQEEHLYRIVQEAVHNAVKHADATRLSVTVRNDANGVALTVEDDGTGFSPRDVAAGHLGLETMRERALALGGSLQIRSAPGEGTTIAVLTPGARPLSP
jgi:PAS domain S-box-containing protein